MKINEILVEHQQLDEGPLGSLARGAGKVIGGVAKGVGALAGIPGGIKKAFQKGKQASTDVIGGTGQGADAAAPDAAKNEPDDLATAAAARAQAAGDNEPAATPADSGTGYKPADITQKSIDQQGPKGTAPASMSSATKAAVAKTAQAADGDPTKAAQTLYAQVKSQINQLDKKGKQRILQLLQKSMTAAPAAPAAAPAAEPAAAPAAAPATTTPAATTPPVTGPGSKTAGTTAAGQPKIEPDLNAPAEQPATAAGKKKPAPKKKVAPSQAEIDADRARLMGPTSDSIIRTGRVVAEGIQIFRQK